MNESNGQDLHFWHWTSVEHLTEAVKSERGVMISSPEHSNNKGQVPEYKWLESQIGFYPIFLGVGSERTAFGLASLLKGGPGSLPEFEFADWVCLSFDINTVEGVFAAFLARNPDPWDEIFKLVGQGKTPSAELIRQMFCPDRKKEDWLALAAKSPMCTMLLARRLEVLQALSIWTISSETKAKLNNLGFANVQLREIVAVEPDEA